MIYRDRIYEKVKIKEPIILELIKSSSLQRLKGIDQAGYLPLLIKILGIPHFKVRFNRFEHSLGVFILLKKFGASLEEQIAGLIHDVSHTTFSHTIDYIVSDGSGKTQCYQDKVLENFIKKSELPHIFKKYKLSLDYLLNKNNFPLLERELPDLCADRIDYSLKTAAIFKEINLRVVKYFLNNLFIQDNSWVFKNPKSAKIYAKLFLKLNRVYFAGFPSAAMFRTVGNLIKYALKKGYLRPKDLFKEDKKVIAKIKKNLSHDEKLHLLFERMQGKTRFKNNPQNYDTRVFCKSRIVDPLCKINSKTKRLSEIDKNWLKIVREESKPKEYFIKYEK